ncbi:phosphatidylserine decarboxylase 1 [Cryptotrichosporon argae]
MITRLRPVYALSPLRIRAAPLPVARQRPGQLALCQAVRYNSSAPPPPPPNPGKENLKSKVSRAWSTPTRWFPIPLALGALVLVAVQWRRTASEPEVTQQHGELVVQSKIDGPWQVRILGALPLRSMSQLWGYLNSLVLPVWFRPFGFKLYARIFGVNLDEVPRPLVEYESLGEFFYRTMKDGGRPIDDAPMVSPADGRVLHFGEIAGSKVEQVKGITYSLEALLGTQDAAYGAPASIERRPSTPSTPTSTSAAASVATTAEATQTVDDEHFARINDIPYSISSLLGKERSARVDEDEAAAEAAGAEHDASHPPDGQDLAHDASVALRLGTVAATTATEPSTELARLNKDHRLFFCVIYLAPGDYHRFHSPAAWVVERRRHFTGDLFSVSPYIANRLKDLFVLNERVALLGRWRHGFFSMTPVGATNVGSIRINFDETLRTNTRGRTHPPHTYTEAVYSGASLLRGQPLLPGEEMGGFRLGSTIVLVFEAPENWRFKVKAGEKIKVGQAMGELK